MCCCQGSILYSSCLMRRLYPPGYDKTIHYSDFNIYFCRFCPTFIWQFDNSSLIMNNLIWLFKGGVNTGGIYLSAERTHGSCLLRYPAPWSILVFAVVCSSQEQTDSILQNGTCPQLSWRNVLPLNQWPIQFHAPCWHLTNKARKVNGIPYVRTHSLYSGWLYHKTT